MALSDSMFLFEITIEELKSFFDYKDFSILSEFADVFQVYLKNPNELETYLPKRPKKKFTKKSKVRGSSTKFSKTSTESKVTVGQSVLIINNNENLKEKMRKFPMEISFRSKYNPEIILASSQIPWSENFLKYLSESNNNEDINSITVDGKYSVFNEYTSKRMATIKLVIKLSCLQDKLATQFKSLSEENQQKLMYTSINSIPTAILNAIKEKNKMESRDISDETGTIKTIYSGGKTRFKRSSESPPITKTSETFKIENKSTDDIKARYTESSKKRMIKDRKIVFVKSDTDLKLKKKVSAVKSQSYYSLESAKRLNALDYIFGDSKGPFGNRIYYVGYFTVQNDFAKEGVSPKSSASPKESIKESKSSEKSVNVREKYQFSLCDDECPSKKAGTYGSPSQCSLDLPKEAGHLISIKKCDNVTCGGAKDREPPSPPDERLMVDLSSMQRDACIMKDKIEEVVGGMKAKLELGNPPCYCSCECTFGFVKKTTYCNICGGVEKFGEEKLGPLAFPCPIYHKLVDKNKTKTASSGSDSKKKSSKHPDKSGESEKDPKKGKKKKKDDRFKFNYGYTAPHIGHSQCAMPCTGTLGAVPKNMGWLWTAEDIPGMRIAKGWKPGAISKRLLRKLNKVKRQTYIIENKRPAKKQKKRMENKPTLIVCKVNGVYVVEMQTAPENEGNNNEQYSPLVYKIAKANNKDKLAKLELKKRRMVKELLADFKDPYHPDICQKTCLKAYRAAVGLVPDDPNNPECTCEDLEQKESSESCYCYYDDVSSDCSSMDVNWEIHFSPPIASHS